MNPREQLMERSKNAHRDIEPFSFTNPRTGEIVQLSVPQPMRTVMPAYYANMQQEINHASPEQRHKMIMNVALKHLEEQRKKGHIKPNGEKGPGFGKHPLPEINAILYNFHYDHESYKETF
jgi:hypothetical protein